MQERASGVLLHITSLPSRYGIGDLGPAAYRFLDFLRESRQRFWQILPLNPTDPAARHSPYHSLSAFAGNPLLISPQLLRETGLLPKEERSTFTGTPNSHLDFGAAAALKTSLLAEAYRNFRLRDEKQDAFLSFCRDHSHWLDDFALFACLSRRFNTRDLSSWPPKIRDRTPDQLVLSARELEPQMEEIKFYQFLFFTQWSALKSYARKQGIKIIGDLPIYVTSNSPDVWAHPEIFDLDKNKKAKTVAGVPPDYFSSSGQLWGNPLYLWDELQQQGYDWWLKRFSHNLRLYDVLRLDHFRGFVAFWAVPEGAKSAARGQWIPAPGEDFFSRILEAFPGASLIAEDLGTITPDVDEVRERFGFPGMKVLQFAFSSPDPHHPYLPHTYPRNCVVYTGTHDNNTARGWFEGEASTAERQRLSRYLRGSTSAVEVAWDLIELGMLSPADLAVTPLQDLLGLGSEARMNRPATTRGNWTWRCLAEQLDPALAERIRELTQKSQRAGDPGRS